MNNEINSYNYAITNVEYKENKINKVVIWEVVYNESKPNEYILTNPQSRVRGFVLIQLRNNKKITTVHINESNIINYYIDGIQLKNNSSFPNVITCDNRGHKYIKTSLNSTLEDNLNQLPNCKLNIAKENI